jgi:succinoglycan biosynthesis transport protein ExoP
MAADVRSAVCLPWMPVMTEIVDLAAHFSHRTGGPPPAGNAEADLHDVVVDSRSSPGPGEDNLAGIIRQLWRRRWLVALLTLTGTVVTGAVAWSIPAVYTAETRLLIAAPGIRVPEIETVFGKFEPDTLLLQSERALVESQEVAQRVIDRLHLADNPAFDSPAFDSNEARTSPAVLGWLCHHLPQVAAWLDGCRPAWAPTTRQEREQRLVDRLLSQLEVESIPQSHVISVKGRAADGVTAAVIANAFAESYLADRQQEKAAAMDRLGKYLKRRIDELNGEVRRSEQAVEDYRRSHGLYKSGKTTVAAQRLGELNAQLSAARVAKIAAEARLGEAEAVGGTRGDETVPEVLASRSVTGLKHQSLLAENRAAQATATYGQYHPDFRGAQAQSAAIAGSVSTEAAKTLASLAREASEAAAHYNALLSNFERAKEEMGVAGDEAIELAALQRDATVNRDLLEAMLKRLQETAGSAAIVQADAKVISPAVPAQWTSYPPKTLLLVLGTLEGFLIAVLVALGLEANDKSFRRPEEVENLLGLPVLAMVPRTSRRKFAGQRKSALGYDAALSRLIVKLDALYSAGPAKVLMLSSAVPGEGKSAIAAALGRQLASSGKRVLLIDCNWRRPRLKALFGCSNPKGLANLLIETDVLLNDCVHRDAQSGVDVVPAGAWRPAMSHLSSGERMAHMLEAFKGGYDLVILDTPSVLVATDALALARIVDEVLFVVRWGSTRRSAVIEAIRRLLDARAALLGIVVTQVVPGQLRDYRISGITEPSLAGVG